MVGSVLFNRQNGSLAKILLAKHCGAAVSMDALGREDPS